MLTIIVFLILTLSCCLFLKYLLLACIYADIKKAYTFPCGQGALGSCLALVWNPLGSCAAVTFVLTAVS